MSNFELEKFDTPDELARAAARAWLSGIRSRGTGAYTVALSGGRIAARFFAALADLAAAEREILSGVHFFWGDERCVGPTDSESNFCLANTHLFLPLSIPQDQIHRIRGEEPPQRAAAEAASELCALAPRNTANQPVMDMIFLGMGEDGHVASLFPSEPETVRADKAVYRPVLATKPPPQRITLGYLPIIAARNVWVLASGPGKKAALTDSLSAAGRTPLAQILTERAQTKIFSDIL